MIKSALVKQISDAKPHLYQQRVDLMLNVILEKIAGALAQGQRVEIRGFGAFSIKSRSPRTGRDPRTGSPVHVKGKKFAHFKPGKEMRKRLNRTDTQVSDNDAGLHP
jgi:integration host factor subunit beta